MGFFDNLLRKSDLFGAQIRFIVDNKSVYQTHFGGVLSIIMLTLILVVTITGTVNLFERTNYTIKSTTNSNIEPEVSIMNKSNFMFALMISNPLNTRQTSENIKKRLFNILFQDIQATTTSNGDKTKTISQEFHLEMCTQDHFSDVNQQKFTQILNQLGEYLCLPINYSISLQGGYNSNIFRYGKLRVTRCLDDDCYSDIEIQSLTNLNTFQLSTFIMSTLLQPHEPQNYLEKYIISDYFLQTNIYQYQVSDIFLEQNKFTIDNSISPFSKENETHNYWSFKLNNVRQNTNYQLTPLNFFEINFRISQEYFSVTKQYYQFDELLSYIGGILKIFTAIVGLIVYQYNSFRLQIYLANQLYNFNLPIENHGQIEYSFNQFQDFLATQFAKVDPFINKFKSNTRKLINLKRVTTLWKSSIPIVIPNNESQDIAAIVNNSNYNINNKNFAKDNGEIIDDYQQIQQLQNSFLNTIFTKLLSNNKQITLGFNFVLYYLFCIRFISKVTYTKRLLDQCTNMIKKDLDVITILSKFQEIGKLKRVILNPQQLELFNYIPKPIVNIDKHFKFTVPTEASSMGRRPKSKKIFKYKDITLIGKKHKFNSKNKLLKLFDAYEMVVPQKSKVGQRLIQLLGKDIQEIFKKALQIKELYESLAKNSNQVSPQSSPLEQQQFGDHMEDQIEEQLDENIYQEEINDNPINDNL